MRLHGTPLALLIAVAARAPAQEYVAASCGLADVQAAIDQELAHPADGDVIVLPAGTATWTGTGIVRAEFTTDVTIRGQGATSSTADGASSVGADATVIVDHLDHGASDCALQLDQIAGKSLRVTGIAVLMDAASTTPANGLLKLAGGSTSVRIDHCHVAVDSGAVGMRFNGSLLGVVDHVLFTSPSDSLTNDLAFHNGSSWNGGDDGDGSWADGDHFGSDRFFFVEDCRFENGDLGDGHEGARYVLRHCTMVNDTVGHGQFFNHGLTSARSRGCRAAEVYRNTFTQPGPIGGGDVVYSLNSGTLLFWGNTVAQYRHAVSIDYTRKDDATYPYGSVPTGWGNCDGVSAWTAWDGPARGYPAIDQPARGAGDLLSGAFPDVIDARTGTIASPGQELSPVYLWGNAYTPAGGYSDAGLVSDQTALVADNRDYYQQFGPDAEPGAFDGTRGVGEGALAARPATAAPGVAYWATDTGTLYRCTAPGTWSAYYRPYQYPHPLTSDGTGGTTTGGGSGGGTTTGGSTSSGTTTGGAGSGSGGGAHRGCGRGAAMAAAAALALSLHQARRRR